MGRSHRSEAAKRRLAEVIERSRVLLGLPDDWRLAIVPASDTGAVEAALFSLLGERGVDVVAFEAFGLGWWRDVHDVLDLSDARLLAADYGELPDLAQVDPDRDVVVTWNGTTSGVRIPDGSWIAPDRRGLVICDATSAAFAMDLPFDRLDVVTWSWQKALGGEAQHGMLALSPRAVERLGRFRPPRPLPKILRLTQGAEPREALFRGETINTPSLLCVEDVLDALVWAEEIGGLEALKERSRNNLAAVERFVASHEAFAFLAREQRLRSSTSICLSVVDPRFLSLPVPRRREFLRRVAARLEAEQAALDVLGYRAAPPGLRLWGGATVEREDLERALPWIAWALEEELSAAS